MHSCNVIVNYIVYENIEKHEKGLKYFGKNNRWNTIMALKSFSKCNLLTKEGLATPIQKIVQCIGFLMICLTFGKAILHS